MNFKKMFSFYKTYVQQQKKSPNQDSPASDRGKISESGKVSTVANAELRRPYFECPIPLYLITNLSVFCSFVYIRVPIQLNQNFFFS